MPSTTSFSTIRKAIAAFDQKALVALVCELYALNTQNRNFLNTRFASDGATIEKYKKIIHKALYPYVEGGNAKISFRDARNAIANYRKALGDENGLAELLVYAAECGNQFTKDYGDIDAPFYDSLCRMFASAVKAVAALDAQTAAPLIERLRAIVRMSYNFGWGYYDCIVKDFVAAFPDA